MHYLDVANSWILWASTVPVVLMVAFQAYLFVRKARESSNIVGLSDSDVKKAFRVGATSAIGPALGVFVVMLGLMAAIGGPIAWQRLAIIGAAPTELAAATMAAKAQNVELGGSGYGLINFANATWVMAMNGSAWLISTGLFADKLEVISRKVSGGNQKKIAILGTAAMLGAMGYLTMNEVAKGLKPVRNPLTGEMTSNFAFVVCALVSGISMVILDKFAKKKMPKLVEYNLGIAMILGMIAAVLYNRVFL